MFLCIAQDKDRQERHKAFVHTCNIQRIFFSCKNKKNNDKNNIFNIFAQNSDDAEDLFNYSKDNLEINDVLVKRNFFFVKENEVNRTRPETTMKPIPGTRTLHQITNMKSKKDQLKVRPLSCFCKVCESGIDNAQCLNETYVRAYKIENLKYEQVEAEMNTSTRSKNKQSKNDTK